MCQTIREVINWNLFSSLCALFDSMCNMVYRQTNRAYRVGVMLLFSTRSSHTLHKKLGQSRFVL